MIDYLNGLVLVLGALTVTTVVVGATGIGLLLTARCATASRRPSARVLEGDVMASMRATSRRSTRAIAR
jgi:hypothetical protein